MAEFIKVTCIGPIAPGEDLTMRLSVDALITQEGNIGSIRRAVNCPALQDDLTCALSPEKQCIYLAPARRRKPQPVPTVIVEGKSLGSQEDRNKLENTFLTLREVSELTRLDMKTISTRMEGLQVTPLTSSQLIEQGIAVSADKRRRYLSLAQVKVIAPDRKFSFQEQKVDAPGELFTETFLSSIFTLNEAHQLLDIQPSTLRRYMQELHIKWQSGPKRNAKYITGEQVKALSLLAEASKKNKGTQ